MGKYFKQKEVASLIFFWEILQSIMSIFPNGKINKFNKP